MRRCITVWTVISSLSLALAESSADDVRLVVTRADGPVAVDGDLQEFAQAISTPVEYFHPDVANRPAQFHYLWDDDAFYIGLRTLDQRLFAPVQPLWEGDAVEWYFDTRRGPDFLDGNWGRGSVHCFWTALEQDQMNPRFCLRPGYLDAISQEGVEVAARRTRDGLEVECKLPWSNFPNFQPAIGEVIGIDAELSYSDGQARSDRTFVFGCPLSVQNSDNLARVQLVDKFRREHWNTCAAVLMPMRVDHPWSQDKSQHADHVLHVVGKIAVPVNHRELIGRILFRVADLSGKELGSYPADVETVLESNEKFVLKKAQWPISLAAPGRYQVLAVVYDRQGEELARIAPRLVSVNMRQGY